MVAEFESDLIRARTREGMQVAKAKGRLRGKQPKLSMTQQKHLIEVHNAGLHSSAELAELFTVARSTVYRTIQRQYESRRFHETRIALFALPETGAHLSPRVLVREQK